MSVTESHSNDEWVLHEKLLTFRQLAFLLPNLHKGKGETVNKATIWRWSTTGCKSKRGKRVRLDARLIGGTNFSSVERLREFINRINDGDRENPPPDAAVPPPVNPP